MLWARYIFLFVLLLQRAAFAENEPPLQNPSQCLLRCKADVCHANAELAASCRTICKGTTFYKKILQACGQKGTEASSPTKPKEPLSLIESYKAKKEAEKAKEFALALSKGQGKRLADIKIEEVQGLSKHEGIDETTGKLTPKGIFEVLQKVDVIPSARDSDDATKALKIRKGQTGAYSDQIYIVSVDPTYLKSHDLAPTYVIKGLSGQGQVSHARENTPQKELQDLEKVKEFIIPQLQGTNVHIATRGGACWYFDMYNKKRYLVVLNAAAGKSLDEWGEQYLKGAIDKDTWMQIMKSVGKTQGQIHFTLATPEVKANFEKGIFSWETFLTTIHGDFHPGNTFFELPDLTTVIDAASMADTLNDKLSPLKDLADLYVKTKYLLFFNNAKGFGWLDEGFKAFVEGYISAFPPASHGVLREAMLQKYREWSRAILNHIQKNGFAPYSANDVIKEIFPLMFIWFKSGKLNPAQVIGILETDEMTK